VGRQHKHSFQAVDDDGGTYTLHVFVDTPNGRAASSPKETTIIRTSGGSTVTDLGNGKYKIDATGKILRASTDKFK
jgi:hypothetical protein